MLSAVSSACGCEHQEYAEMVVHAGRGHPEMFPIA